MVDATLYSKLKKKYGSETVYVVPASKLFWIKDGFTIDKKVNLLKALNTQGKIILRCDAEYNNSVLQIIPYIILVSADDKRIYVSRRIGGDERLLNNWSFFGGHISLDDINAENFIITAAERELNEEVKFQKVKNTALELLGTIRDSTSATSEHIGIVFYQYVNWAKIRELDKLTGKWMTYYELIANYSKFESWARMVIDQLFIRHTTDKLFSDWK